MEKRFRTNDISLAAFLLTQGITLIDITEEGHLRYCFLLSNPGECEPLHKKFLNNAPAPAQELFSKREMLIAEIKNASQGL